MYLQVPGLCTGEFLWPLRSIINVQSPDSVVPRITKKSFFLDWSDSDRRDRDWLPWMFSPWSLLWTIFTIQSSSESETGDRRVDSEHVEGLPGCLCCLYRGGARWPSWRREGHSVRSTQWVFNLIEPCKTCQSKLEPCNWYKVYCGVNFTAYGEDRKVVPQPHQMIQILPVRFLSILHFRKLGGNQIWDKPEQCHPAGQCCVCEKTCEKASRVCKWKRRAGVYI